MNSSQQFLANRYQLLRQLAAGSFAETWLAIDLVLDRHVAIKLLHSSGEEDEQYEHEQFLREARIAAAVSHQNVVAVFDGGTKDCQPFLVMEWVNGRSLKQEIRGHRVGLTRAITVTSELLAGLSSIHEQGIIHRDIKPQNIMVNEFGTVKLTDFGIARLVGEPDGRSDGTTAGSAAYMAPEQARGLPVGPAADVYAAGIILFEMLTGRLPFVDEDPQQVILQHIAEPVLPPRMLNPGIPAEIEAIILRALEKEPADRFQSADEMHRALGEAQHQVLAWRPAQPAYQFEAPSRLSIPRLAWIAASIAMMFVMVAGATTLAVRDSGTLEAGTLSEVAETTEIPEPTAEPEPTSAQQPEPTVTPAPEDGEVERPPVENNDQFRVQGEVVVEGQPEPVGGTNRPAPSRAISDEEVDQPEPEESGQEVVADDGQQQWTPPPPAPTPIATPTPQPDDANEVINDDENDNAEGQQPSEEIEEAANETPDEDTEPVPSDSDENAESPEDNSSSADDSETEGQGETEAPEGQGPDATPDLDNSDNANGNGNGQNNDSSDVAEVDHQNDDDEQISNQAHDDDGDQSGYSDDGSEQSSESDEEDQQTSTQQAGDAVPVSDVDEKDGLDNEKNAQTRDNRKNETHSDDDDGGENDGRDDDSEGTDETDKEKRTDLRQDRDSKSRPSDDEDDEIDERDDDSEGTDETDKEKQTDRRHDRDDKALPDLDNDDSDSVERDDEETDEEDDDTDEDEDSAEFTMARLVDFQSAI